jgi:glycerophosphoryl diester phosphodiesterase
MRLSLLKRLDRWLAPAPDPRRIGWLKAAQFAHRGLHSPGVPENTPSAFAAAVAQGLGIECDVQITQDHQAVVFHDYDLDRLTNARGPIAQRSAADLHRVVLSGSTDTIPTLAQIKSHRGSPVAALCRAVDQALSNYTGPHAVMSFDPRICRWFAAQAPQTPRGLVMTEEHDSGLIGGLRRHLWLWIARPDFLAYDIRDLPSRFAAAQRQRGLPLATWTVRSSVLRERALAHADAPIAEEAGVAR